MVLVEAYTCASIEKYICEGKKKKTNENSAGVKMLAIFKDRTIERVSE